MELCSKANYEFTQNLYHLLGYLFFLIHFLIHCHHSRHYTSGHTLHSCCHREKISLHIKLNLFSKYKLFYSHQLLIVLRTPSMTFASVVAPGPVHQQQRDKHVTLPARRPVGVQMVLSSMEIPVLIPHSVVVPLTMESIYL